MPSSSMFYKPSATIKAVVTLWEFDGDGINTAPSTLHGPKPQKLWMDDDCSTWATERYFEERRMDSSCTFYVTTDLQTPRIFETFAENEERGCF